MKQHRRSSNINERKSFGELFKDKRLRKHEVYLSDETSYNTIVCLTAFCNYPGGCIEMIFDMIDTHLRKEVKHIF